MKISKETKIGVMVIVAFGCLIWGYNFIKGKNLFSNNTIYYSTYSDVDGLAPACPVFINGLQVGRVTELKLQPDNTIKAKLSLDHGLEVPINTIAEIRENSLFGGRTVTLLIGNDTQLAPSESDLKGFKQASLSETLDPLKGKITVLLNNADSILVSINNILSPEVQKSMKHSIHSIEASLQHIEGITNKLDKSSKHFENIFADVESVTTNLKNNNDKINHIISNIDTVTTNIANADIHKTILTLNNVSDNLDSILVKVNTGKGTLGLLINDPKLYNTLNNSISHIDTLILDFKTHPKNYINLSVFGGKTTK